MFIQMYFSPIFYKITDVYHLLKLYFKFRICSTCK